MTVFLVGIGGFFGVLLRYGISRRLNMNHFPYGTLMINLAGSFLLGCLAGRTLSGEWMLLLGTGFMGAFTTFSTLNWECIQFYQSKEWKKLGIYLGGSYVFGITLAFIGYIATHK